MVIDKIREERALTKVPLPTSKHFQESRNKRPEYDVGPLRWDVEDPDEAD